MKQAKKFASLLLALLIVLSLAAPAFATGEDPVDPPAAEEIVPTWDVTIHGPDSITLKDRTFNAYKIMDLKVMELQVDDDPTIVNGGTQTTGKNYVYTIPDEWLPFFQDQFPDVDVNALDYDTQIRMRMEALRTQSLGGNADQEPPTEWPDAGKDLYTFGVAARNYARDNGIAATQSQTGGETNTILFTDLPQGYYLFDDAAAMDKDVAPTTEAVSAVMLRSVDQDLNVYAKVTVATIDKKILNSRDGDENYTNGAMGDCVQFELTSKVPDTHGYTDFTFRFNDTMSPGLIYYSEVSDDYRINGNLSHEDSYITDSHVHEMVVKVGDRTLVRQGAATPDKDYNIYTLTIESDTATGETKLTIDLPGILAATQANDWQEGETVSVTYYAWIDQVALIVEDTNPNTVDLTYSNNPNVLVKYNENGEPVYPDDEEYDDIPGEPRHPQGTTPEDKVWVLTGKINVKKVDPAGNPLTGAGFTLTGNDTTQSMVYSGEIYELDMAAGTWYQLANGTYTQEVPVDGEPDDGGTAHLYKTTEVDSQKVIAKYTLTQKQEILKGEGTEKTELFAMVDEEGMLSFSGLSEGVYTLTETVVPAGYNKIEQPIVFELKLVHDSNGTDTDYTDDAYHYALYMDADKDGDREQVDVTYTDDTDPSKPAVHELSITVVNQAGQRLPSTGGMGTTLFYVVGAGLALAAIVLLITKKRMNG